MAAFVGGSSTSSFVSSSDACPICVERPLRVGVATRRVERLPGGGAQWQMVTKKQKRKRQRRKMRRPHYQLDRSLLKLKHLFEDHNAFLAYGVLMYLRTRAHTPDLDTYKGLLDGFDEVGTIGDVETVLEEMRLRQVEPDVEAMTIVLNAYAKRKNFDKMRQTYHEMTELFEQLDAKVFLTMIEALRDAGRRQEAEWAYSEMLKRNIHRDASYYEAKMQILRSREQYDEMDLCFHDLVDTYGFEPSESAVYSRLEAYAEADWFNLAEQAFADISTFFLPQTERTYVAMFRMYIGHGDYEKVLDLYDKLKQDNVDFGCGTLELLFDGFYSVGDTQSLELIFADMFDLRIGPSVPIMDRLLRLYSDLGKSADFLRVLKCKIKADLDITRNDHTQLWEMIGFVVKGGRASDLVRRLMMTFPSETRNFNLSLAYDGLLCHDMLDEALNIVESMDERGLKPSAALFNSTVEFLCRQDMPDPAVTVLQELQQLHHQLSRRSFEPLVRFYTQIRDVEVAVGLLIWMHKLDFVPRYSTRRWIYEQEWREPAVTAALVVDPGHRIPYYDPAALGDFSKVISQRSALKKVRKPRFGRAGMVEELGVDLDSIIDETVGSDIFIGDATKLYHMLRKALLCVKRENRRRKS
mmetsp:Transcript_2260/g.6746  ORF Transcript_2260/g.6746 Transcript_2260/m.6746 type:complete len:638 (+) Transcript_2260:45-1958(+)